MFPFSGIQMEVFWNGVITPVIHLNRIFQDDPPAIGVPQFIEHPPIYENLSNYDTVYGFSFVSVDEPVPNQNPVSTV